MSISCVVNHMSHFVKIIVLLFFGYSQMSAQQWNSSDLEIYEHFEDADHLFQFQNDTTYLINFWATWCKPCVEELPYIEQVVNDYKGEKFKSILISLDFERQIESKLIPFLNKNEIESEVVVLTDGKSSKWIDLVDVRWSGSIPMTIVYNKKERAFHEGIFHSKEEIKEIVNKFLIK